MKASRPPFLFRELSADLRAVSFGVGRSLSASANAFCGRQRMEASQAPSSRPGDSLSKVCMSSVSLALRPFGGAGRALNFESASCFGSLLLQTPTPNQALQRTGAAVAELCSLGVATHPVEANNLQLFQSAMTT